MNKKAVIAAVILTAAAAIVVCIFLLSGSNGEHHIAVITSDGSIIRTVDLDTAPDEVFTVESDGGSNTVCIKDGEIYVTEASCPDKICVKHGALRSELLPIVCLPNRLVIELR